MSITNRSIAYSFQASLVLTGLTQSSPQGGLEGKCPQTPSTPTGCGGKTAAASGKEKILGRRRLPKPHHRISRVVLTGLRQSSPQGGLGRRLPKPHQRVSPVVLGH